MEQQIFTTEPSEGMPGLDDYMLGSDERFSMPGTKIVTQIDEASELRNFET